MMTGVGHLQRDERGDGPGAVRRRRAARRAHRAHRQAAGRARALGGRGRLGQAVAVASRCLYMRLLGVPDHGQSGTMKRKKIAMTCDEVR
jgi:hypothetical protein